MNTPLVKYSSQHRADCLELNRFFYKVMLNAFTIVHSLLITFYHGGVSGIEVKIDYCSTNKLC